MAGSDPPGVTAIQTPGTRPLRRSIRGISAVLLPVDAAGAIDWVGFAAHVARTVAAGIVPAVNMDTGHVHRLAGDALVVHVGAVERAQVAQVPAVAAVLDHAMLLRHDAVEKLNAVVGMPP